SVMLASFLALRSALRRLLLRESGVEQRLSPEFGLDMVPDLPAKIHATARQEPARLGARGRRRARIARESSRPWSRQSLREPCPKPRDRENWNSAERIQGEEIAVSAPRQSA